MNATSVKLRAAFCWKHFKSATEDTLKDWLMIGQKMQSDNIRKFFQVMMTVTVFQITSTMMTIMMVSQMIKILMMMATVSLTKMKVNTEQ